MTRCVIYHRVGATTHSVWMRPHTFTHSVGGPPSDHRTNCSTAAFHRQLTFTVANVIALVQEQVRWCEEYLLGLLFVGGLNWQWFLSAFFENWNETSELEFDGRFAEQEKTIRWWFWKFFAHLELLLSSLMIWDWNEMASAVTVRLSSTWQRPRLCSSSILLLRSTSTASAAVVSVVILPLLLLAAPNAGWLSAVWGIELSQFTV